MLRSNISEFPFLPFFLKLEYERTAECIKSVSRGTWLSINCDSVLYFYALGNWYKTRFSIQAGYATRKIFWTLAYHPSIFFSRVSLGDEIGHHLLPQFFVILLGKLRQRPLRLLRRCLRTRRRSRWRGRRSRRRSLIAGEEGPHSYTTQAQSRSATPSSLFPRVCTKLVISGNARGNFNVFSFLRMLIRSSFADTTTMQPFHYSNDFM